MQQAKRITPNAISDEAASQALSHAKRTATHYKYTAAGLIAKITHTAGHTSRFAYNETGQLIQLVGCNKRSALHRM
ncbi:MAG: hypothetical protein AB1810_02365 [Pseudomonadota bacterium]